MSLLKGIKNIDKLYIEGKSLSRLYSGTRLIWKKDKDAMSNLLSLDGYSLISKDGYILISKDNG